MSARQLVLAVQRHAGLLADRAPAAAARLLGSVRREAANLIIPQSPAELDQVERLRARCRAVLGTARFEEEYRRGDLPLSPVTLLAGLAADLRAAAAALPTIRAARLNVPRAISHE